MTLHHGWTRGAQFLAVAAVVCAIVAKMLGAAENDAPLEPVPVPPPQNLSDQVVLDSIHRGVDFLLKDLDTKLQTFQAMPSAKLNELNQVQNVGEMVLEIYALLHVGTDTDDLRLKPRDPRMQAAIDLLTRVQLDSTYTTALQSLAFAELPQSPEVKRAITHAAERLVRGTGSAGGYTYQINLPSRDSHDQSNSQYGLLGVWAAADSGVAISPRYWRQTDDFWRSIQSKNGGWGYGGGGPDETATSTMTAAGVASLYVCNEFLDRVPTLRPRTDKVLDRGMSALVEGFNPQSADFYYLYGIERVGLASGLKYLGGTNWYREAALNLLKLQQADGSFAGNFIGANAVRSTAYGLLFLIRGRAPVVMNKLSYTGLWNVRGRDSANLHAHLGRMLERHLNWQIVPIDAPFQEWMDAPILLITGSQDPHFSADDVTKLRQFVDAGGIIFSTADGNSTQFSEAIERYATAMAGPGRPYRKLPDDHPLYSVFGKPKTPPTLYGVSNGVRELWIHSPLDYGAIWQARLESATDAWELPARLFFYAAGQTGLRSKLQSLIVPDPPAPPTRSIAVAQLQYDGNWNAEPGAWPRLGKLLALNSGPAMDLQNVPITDLNTLARRQALAHLTGTGKLTLTDAEQHALSVYVQTGGTLFVEAIGGDADFASSSQELLAKLFPQSPIKTIPPTYLLYNGGISPLASKVESVDYRKFWILSHGPSSVPRVQFITVGGRVGVFFSADDVTSGLLGTNTWGINGYMPASAIAIARDIVLFASVNAPKAK